MSRLRDDTFPRPNDLVDPDPRDRDGALYARSYLLTRMIIGIIGIVLPILFIIGEAFFLREGVHVRGSISAYYHTSMRDAFVAGLCITGFFLGTYMAGHANKDFWWSLVASMAVIGVVFFPTQRSHLLDNAPRCGTTPMPDGCSPVQQWLGENLVAGMHFTFAAIFILSLARIGFLFAKREKELEKDSTDPSLRIGILSSKTSRVRILYACAWVILGAVALAIVGAVWKFTIWELTPLYMAEVASVWAFGIAWFLKSRALWAALGHPVKPSDTDETMTLVREEEPGSVPGGERRPVDQGS
jgi:MFS family permease